MKIDILNPMKSIHPNRRVMKVFLSIVGVTLLVALGGATSSCSSPNWDDNNLRYEEDDERIANTVVFIELAALNGVSDSAGRISELYVRNPDGSSELWWMDKLSLIRNHRDTQKVTAYSDNKITYMIGDTITAEYKDRYSRLHGSSSLIVPRPFDDMIVSKSQEGDIVATSNERHTMYWNLWASICRYPSITDSCQLLGYTMDTLGKVSLPHDSLRAVLKKFPGDTILIVFIQHEDIAPYLDESRLQLKSFQIRSYRRKSTYLKFASNEFR